MSTERTENEGHRDSDRELARDFRQLSQAEQLRDSRMNAGAKVIAAIDAAIDRKYGASTPAADTMKRAARESVAQSIEQGRRIAVPRVREAERQQNTAMEQTRAAGRLEPERDR